MAVAIRLPKMGKSMKEGTIVNILIKKGDEISKGDVIFEVETDKATLEIESDETGTVKHVLIGDGETVAVDTALAVVGDSGEDFPHDFIKKLAKEKQDMKLESTAEDQEIEIPAISNKQIHTSITGGGETENFVPGDTKPLGRLQKLVGARMLQSKLQIPCFYLSIKADVTELVQLRAKMNASADINTEIEDFVLYALARCLRKYPVMTAQIMGDNLVTSRDICIGVVTEVEGGAVAPVIRDVDTKTVAEIAEERQRLAATAREGKLTLEQLNGACISITNMGDYGVEMFIPIVVPGQCSIIGLGRIIDTCIPARKKEVEVRKIMKMTISVDHRIANGADAGQFIDYAKKMLETADNFA